MLVYRSVFISDLHLGSKHCRVAAVLNFLKNVRCENLYLVGDIIDGWRLQKKWYWPKEHTDVLRQIMRMSNKGVNVVYIPGNHDEFLRTIIGKGTQFGNIKIQQKAVYESLKGERILVVHGDLFDYLMKTKFGRRVMSLGDWAYDVVAWINIKYNQWRKWRGLPLFSVAKYLKAKAKAAANFVGTFEEEMANYCKSKRYHGIICGHIHTPRISTIHGILYMNDGDWVENCSALVETLDGEWKII